MGMLFWVQTSQGLGEAHRKFIEITDFPFSFFYFLKF